MFSSRACLSDDTSGFGSHARKLDGSVTERVAGGGDEGMADVLLNVVFVAIIICAVGAISRAS
jgi:hypothetical protein